MQASEISAIVHGYHGNPYGVLGAHLLPTGWTVRCWAPGRRSVSLLLNGKEYLMKQLDAAGLFVVDVPVEPVVYTYRSGDDTWEDPWRFRGLLSADDLHLHTEGTLLEAWRVMGAHVMEYGGVRGVRFAVWAPHAEAASVCGPFNRWNDAQHPMSKRDGGIWELFIPGLGDGDIYKYCLRSTKDMLKQLKADPYAFWAEVPPDTASRVFDLNRYQWNDHPWMEQRAQQDLLKRPFSLYEVHAESWRHGPNGEILNWDQLGDALIPYVQELGFTHIELMPIQEHPFSGSWGYQVTGYFAPTSRFGSPDQFRRFVDRCHQAGIGIILDWVPAHFPRDAHGLAYFDGTHLYEHADPRQGAHLDWGTLIFNFGRNEVCGFLIASALYWLREYHLDGLRVDAVASMLYLDYSREGGDWVPNMYGGRENLDAIDFLRRMNAEAHKVPGAVTIAEESTSFPGVSRPVYLGGLGFTMKWNMGWMHDMFRYFKTDPYFRRYSHQNITFSMLYAFTENFLLPISHDEVVHGKSSLIGKMPGDEWQRFANVRAFLSYMYGHPGKKLLFMGQEIGQYEEWNEKSQLAWPLLQFPLHKGLHDLLADLNRIYTTHPALYEVDFHWDGFEWIDIQDVDNSVISFQRHSKDKAETVVFICNFTPMPRHDYSVGVNSGGAWQQILNSDHPRYGGSGVNVMDVCTAEEIASHGRPWRLRVSLPPLGVMAFLSPDQKSAKLKQIP
jgi:1,4-alpha-glucan branching enzyme